MKNQSSNLTKSQIYLIDVLYPERLKQMKYDLKKQNIGTPTQQKNIIANIDNVLNAYENLLK